MPNRQINKNIPRRVSKARRLWESFLRHNKYFSSFNRTAYWTGIVSGLLRAPINASKIFLTGMLVDSILDYYKFGASLDIFVFSVPMPIVYVLLLVIAGRLSMILDQIIAISQIKIRNDALSGYKKTVAQKYHNLNSQEVDKENVKDMLTKIESYWLANATSMYSNLINIGGFFLSIGIAFYTLYSTSPIIAFIVILAPTLQILVEHYHFEKHTKFVDDIAPVMLERNYLYGALTDARSFPERKINGVYRALIERYEHYASIVNFGYKNVLIRAERDKIMVNLIDHFMLTILKIIVVMSHLTKKTPVGHITYIIGYMDSLYSNAYDVQYSFITMLDQLAFVDHLYEFLDVEGFADYRKKGKNLKEGSPKIEFDKVDFMYIGSKKQILKEADLEINPGERVLILGKDGTGKSSLLSLIAGMYATSSGHLKYDGIAIDKLARGSVKRKISVVPEDFARYYMSMRENILLGDPAKPFDEKLYNKALEITGLDVWLKANNLTDDKILGNYFEGSIAISSGHWQRIAIARAIYRNRDIFLFDQPFTYIDSESADEIMPKLIKFIGKRTAIFINEHTWHSEFFTKIVKLENQKFKVIKSTNNGKKRIIKV